MDYRISSAAPLLVLEEGVTLLMSHICSGRFLEAEIPSLDYRCITLHAETKHCKDDCLAVYNGAPIQSLSTSSSVLFDEGEKWYRAHVTRRL